uniref:PGG domain-containing protein n=1 Tax=Chenopodium quinoa TaxID=63459 RepID=A0A803MYF4_CHEQI
MSIIQLLLQKSEVSVNERDKDGVTPLLRAALQSHFCAVKTILDEHPECLEMCDLEGKTVLHLLKFQSYDEAKKFFHENPRVLNLKDQQDNMGNTPAHIAVMNCIERISKEQDASVTMKFQSCEEVMKFMKTSHQLSLKDGVDDQGNEAKENMTSPAVVMNCTKNTTNEQKIKREQDIIGVEILEANKWAATYRDAYGLTPLLKAAKNGQIEVVKQIWETSPESAHLRDCGGRTFWHMLDMADTTKEQEGELVKKAHKKEFVVIVRLSSATDNVGKTPLVQAINDHNYNLAQVLSKITKRSVNEVLAEQAVSMRYTLFILSIASYLPAQLEKELWKKMKNLGVKSIFGVPKSEISNYTNTIGVIAALLATIAFQGAFAVPGGYHSDDGYPVLFKKHDHLSQKDAAIEFYRVAAFWVFMVADILTMCLSMMVLFCLQWILTGDDKEKFVITDLCLCLLNLGFMTTFVAFMMGVFASNYHMESALAIFTVAVCSTIMLLLQKCVVMRPLQYVFLTVYLAIT